jgi:citrate synthase
VLDALPAFARMGTVMSALRTALSLAGQNARPWLDLAQETRAGEAMRLTALMPSVVAAVWRVRQGEQPVASQAGLGVAADSLQMLTGKMPDASAVQAVERARPRVERKLAAGERIMGFGHRVRTEDPRSAALKETALALGGRAVELAIEVERVALDVLERKYPERKLRTNVEFYAGVVLHEIGLQPELFSPTFAVSRMIGWIAHAVEQTQRNRILRPASRYVGPLHRT